MTATTIALGLLACGPSEVPDSAGSYLRDADKLQPIATQFALIASAAVSAGAIEGVQFAVVEEGGGVNAEAFGFADRESKRPMTVATPINVASISKALTAWGVLALAASGELDLDAVAADASGLSAVLFAGADVTPRMLLSHTSGLSGRSVPVTPMAEPMPSLADILLGRSSVPKAVLEGLPGARFSYSGAGFLLLQSVVEDRTGRTFAAYMADTVLAPAQMADSTFAPVGDGVTASAVYYRADGRRREPYHLPGAAGGLYSTAGDMARLIMLYTEHGQILRDQMISAAGFEAMLRPVAAVDDSPGQPATLHYALGHYTYRTREGVKIVFHGGGNPGLRALMVIAPERNMGFFAVANHDRGSEVLTAMLDAWGEFHHLTMHRHF